MDSRDARPVFDAASAPVYEQALDAVVQAVRDELRAAQNRLAMPAEIEPLRDRLAALESWRRKL